MVGSSMPFTRVAAIIAILGMVFYLMSQAPDWIVFW
jgi:hypothetical protein